MPFCISCFSTLCNCDLSVVLLKTFLFDLTCICTDLQSRNEARTERESGFGGATVCSS